MLRGWIQSSAIMVTVLVGRAGWADGPVLMGEALPPSLSPVTRPSLPCVPPSRAALSIPYRLVASSISVSAVWRPAGPALPPRHAALLSLQLASLPHIIVEFGHGPTIAGCCGALSRPAVVERPQRWPSPLLASAAPLEPGPSGRSCSPAVVATAVALAKCLFVFWTCCQ